MFNLDKMSEQKTEIMNRLADGIRNNDENAMATAMKDWGEIVQQAVISEAKGILSSADSTILSTRGVRQLTTKETKYYNCLIDYMKNEGKYPIGADSDKVMPETVFESVLEDIKTNHPLLNAISFKDTTAITSLVYNKQGEQRAVWGPLNSEIIKELEGEIATMSTRLSKLTAFMYISKDMLELGPNWLDRYVRETLSEACAVGLEVGIVDGNGKDMPIGMTRSVADNVTITGGEYPRKTPISITSFDVLSYGTVLAMLSHSPNGKYRTVSSVILVVNPEDYFSKIMPATTLLLPDGTYRNNIFPFPTTVIQSVGVPKGNAVIGLPKRYFTGVGTSRSGVIEYSDEYKFLEDFRTCTIRLYGTGRPLDDNAFVVLDINNLTETMPTIVTQNYNETRLASLSIGSLELEPAFDKNILFYTATTSNASNTITATAKDTEAMVTIKNGNSTVTSGQSATWSEGLNTVKITVSNNGSDKVYTIAVDKT